MFWLKRFKTDQEDAHWSLPFGDLMSLLLAIFVMIAAMSELKSGAHYRKVAGGVRQAFGFADQPPQDAIVGLFKAPPMTLLERLEKMTVTGTGPLQLNAGGDESLAPCEVVSQPDRLILRPVGEASFERHSGVLKPAAQNLVARLADYLTSGQSSVEVRGYADDQPIPAGVPYRDAWDLSYQRARAATEVLIRRGVVADRVSVVAMGNRNAAPGPEDSPAGTALDRCCRLEIVIQAAADERSTKIAGKEQVNNGQ